MDKKLLDILCCPVSKVPVTPLGKDMLRDLNALAEEGKLKYVDNRPVKARLEGALITTDKRTIYAIESGIPIMLPEQGIPSDQLPQ